MLCVTANFMVKKICDVLLTASWRRRAVFYHQPHNCEEDVDVFFYKFVPPVPSPEPGRFVWVGHAPNKDLFEKK